MKPCDHKRILIADDDVVTRLLYDAIISENIHGVKVDLAASGEEAVEFFSRKHHGIILIDQRMPILDGIGALKLIEDTCARKGWKMPAVVLCTSYIERELHAELMNRNPPCCILQKPIHSVKLLEALQLRLHGGS